MKQQTAKPTKPIKVDLEPIAAQFNRPVDPWGLTITTKDHLLSMDAAGLLVIRKGAPEEVVLVPWANLNNIQMRPAALTVSGQ